MLTGPSTRSIDHHSRDRKQTTSGANRVSEWFACGLQNRHILYTEHQTCHLFHLRRRVMRRIVLVVILACLVALPLVGVRAQGSGTYTVQPGDNLFRIALRFHVSIAAIQQANNISDANLIFVGQVLTIPGATGTVSPTSVPTGGSAPTPAPSSGGGSYTV